MTTNLFVIPNVKELRTYVVLEFYCPFFPNILVCWRPKFSIFLNNFHSRVEFGTIFLEGLRNFGGGGLNTRNPALGTPLVAATVFSDFLLQNACPCTKNALALYFCMISQYYLQQSKTRLFSHR